MNTELNKYSFTHHVDINSMIPVLPENIHIGIKEIIAIHYNSIQDGIYECINEIDGQHIFYGTIINGSINGEAMISPYLYFNNHPLSKNMKIIVNFNNNKLHGPCKTYYENGQFRKQSEWKNNILDYTGLNLEYWENENLKINTECISNKCHGPCLEYWENCNLKEDSTYIHGNVDGACLEYWQNGNLKIKTTYVNNKLHGSYLEYWENGILNTMQTYVDGKAHGNC